MTIENALIVPGQKRSDGLGVLDASGAFVPESIIWRMDAPLFEPPIPVEPEAELAGTHLFGGIMSWHFGHFLVESLSRLWPLHSQHDDLASVLFVPKGPADKQRSETRFQREVLDIIAPDIPREVLTRPTRVERLIVPEQGFGTAQLETGTAAFRAFIKSRAWPAPNPDAPKCIYVSRADLNPQKKGRIIGDTNLADFLARRGYHVVHPQKLNAHDQLALYRGARRLIFDDGSALHLFGLVAETDQTVASIQRRLPQDGKAVGERQLRSFAETDLKVFDAVLRDWRPKRADRPTSQSDGELDARHLFEALRGYGATQEGDTPEDLGLPTPAEAAASATQMGYIPVERDVALPSPPALSRFWGIEIPDGPHLNTRKIRSLRDGFYERQEVRNALAHFGPSDRVLELGAGAGIVGTTVAVNCQVEALLSFEANPRMVPVAQALYARNNLSNRAEARHAVLVADPDAPTTLPFAIAEDYLGSKLANGSDIPLPTAQIAQVSTVQLSDIVAEFHPTALLMDIEGAELPFLQSADLSPFRAIVVELHRGIYERAGMRACRAALKAAGLRQVPDYCRRGVDTWIRDP
ncbi:FkbM family methyltransferase [Gymnodinialimonas sp. 2305UL16-5]